MPGTQKRDKSPRRRKPSVKALNYKSERNIYGCVTKEGPLRIEVSGTTYIRVRPGTVLLFDLGSKVTISTRSKPLVLQTFHPEEGADTLKYHTEGDDIVHIDGIQ
jgi:hypothetical protein